MSGPLFLHGIGHFHPENVIDNALLEELAIGTDEGWILERVGIRQRRTVLPLDYIRTTKNRDPAAGHKSSQYNNAETGKRAALMALQRAGLDASSIGLVIAGGCSAEMSIPAEACRIAAALDIEAPALDINSACSSFAAQLHFLRNMNDLPDYVLVVNPENTTRVVDYSDRATAVLWGDGTSAAIVSKRVPSRARFTETTFTSSPRGHGAVVIPKYGHFEQDGSTVQHFAIRTSVNCLRALLPEARAYLARQGGRLRFIGHQANLLMLQAIARRCELSDDEHWYNVDQYGNTGAAGAPIVLSQRWDELASGDVVLMVMVGSGLSWGSLRLLVES